MLRHSSAGDLTVTIRSVLEASPDAMVLVNSAGTIALINSETERMFGYKGEELIDHPVDILLPEEFATRHRAHCAEYFSAPRSRRMGVGLDLWGQRRDGSRFPVEISLTPLRSERGLLVAAAIRELTAGIALTQRLMRLLMAVEDELGTLWGNARCNGKASPLTARESQVIGLATEGLSTGGIAGELVISPTTVKTHLENIYRKLGAPDRAAAVARAIRMGLIP
jgi:PAS domain S-box-containing protein